MKRKLTAAIGIAGMMVSIAACGGEGGGGSDKGADAKELTVWLTVDAQNNWPDLVKAADAAVKKKHPGVKINHEYYGWPDKNAKLDAVLATDKAPDVVEMEMAEEDIDLGRCGSADVRPQRHEARPGIHDEQAFAAPDFDTGSVTAELDELRPGGTGRPSGSPEPNPKGIRACRTPRHHLRLTTFSAPACAPTHMKDD